MREVAVASIGCRWCGGPVGVFLDLGHQPVAGVLAVYPARKTRDLGHGITAVSGELGESGAGDDCLGSRRSAD